MKKIRELLHQMGILFGLLWSMMLLGGIFEGSVALPAGLLGLGAACVGMAILCRGLSGRRRRAANDAAAHARLRRQGRQAARSPQPAARPSVCGQPPQNVRPNGSLRIA